MKKALAGARASKVAMGSRAISLRGVLEDEHRGSGGNPFVDPLCVFQGEADAAMADVCAERAVFDRVGRALDLVEDGMDQVVAIELRPVPTTIAPCVVEVLTTEAGDGVGALDGIRARSAG